MRRQGIDRGEALVLEMVQELYGKRWHHLRECFRNVKGDTLLAIKNREGLSQFTLNLTVLSQIKQQLDTGFVQTHLLQHSNCDEMRP